MFIRQVGFSDFVHQIALSDYRSNMTNSINDSNSKTTI
nr:MAG TPA: hypothetical protein [Bacteriophage sp.]